MSDSTLEFNPVIIAPSYNNAATLQGVLERLDALGLPLIVVNDGSTDQTAAVLAGWGQRPGKNQRFVLTHAANRGKGAALLTGFREAARMGYTHAATIDTDGQLAPEQLPAFLEAAAAGRDALILGHRGEDTPHLPRSNLAGWYLSALGFWLETGLVIHDTQCGLRVYPLGLFDEVTCRCGRFGFETELLARAIWAGYSLALAPVTCHYAQAGKQQSHLKPVRDGIKGFFMHWGLALRRLLPVRRLMLVRRGVPTYRWKEWASPLGIVARIRSSRIEQLITSAAFAHGAFLACMPLGGLQFVLLPYTARRLHHNLWAAAAGLGLLVPPIGSGLGWLSVDLGSILTGQARLEEPPPVLLGAGFWETFSRFPVGWLCGAVAVGTLVHWLVIGVLFLLLRLAPTKARSRQGNAAVSDLNTQGD